MSAVVDVAGLRKRFARTTALDGVDLTLHAGELVGLIGHNGAGKSTLFKILSGQLLPGEGSVRVCGHDVSADPAGARGSIGFVPEEPSLWGYLTAREFLEFVVGVRGGGDIDAALDLAGLGEDCDRLIREYSQGMRRKTALAAALVSRPPLLLLDEALNGLDPPSAARVKAELRARCDDGATVLLSTHVLDTVEKVADRVVMMAAGRVIADVRVAEIGPDGLEKMFLGMTRPG